MFGPGKFWNVSICLLSARVTEAILTVRGRVSRVSWAGGVGVPVAEAVVAWGCGLWFSATTRTACGQSWEEGLVARADPPHPLVPSWPSLLGCRGVPCDSHRILRPGGQKAESCWPALPASAPAPAPHPPPPVTCQSVRQDPTGFLPAVVTKTLKFGVPLSYLEQFKV